MLKNPPVPLLLNAPAGRPAIRLYLDGNLVLVLLILYPLLRFFVGSPGLAPLVAALLLLTYASMALSYLGRFVFFAAAAALCTVAAIAARAAGVSTVGNYYAFLAIYLFIVPCLTSVKVAYEPAFLRALLLFFSVTCFAFFLLPSLSDMASTKYIVALEETRGYLSDELQDEAAQRFTALAADRFHAYFIHSNEFGLFVAALIFILLRGDDGSFRQRMNLRDLSLSAALILLALMSGSLSTCFVLGMTILMRVMPMSLVRLAAFAVLTALFSSQIFFPVTTAVLLQTGSMFWRYMVADIILSNSTAVQFAPALIGLVGNWPHSIFLDFVFISGWLGAPLLFVAISVFALFYLPADRGTGVLIFFTCAALQPAGAMPSSFLILALALCGWNSGSFSRRGLATI